VFSSNGIASLLVSSSAVCSTVRSFAAYFPLLNGSRKGFTACLFSSRWIAAGEPHYLFPSFGGSRRSFNAYFPPAGW
jgi:hypothetical protein